MSEALKFDIISPSKIVLSDEAALVIVPGIEGDLGALKGRMPITLMLRAGVVYIMNDGSNVSQRIFVDGGYAQVEPEKLCILCESSLDLDHISESDIKERLEKAEQDYKNADDSNKELALKALETAKTLDYCFHNPSYR